jgi:hypothetical protein
MYDHSNIGGIEGHSLLGMFGVGNEWMGWDGMGYWDMGKTGGARDGHSKIWRKGIYNVKSCRIIHPFAK